METNFQTEKLVEKKCEEIMAEYDERLGKLEDELKTKCNAEDLRHIIQEELDKSRPTASPNIQGKTQQLQYYQN